MTSLFRLLTLALAVVGCAVLCGCLPTGQGQADEEKESHFLAGRARVNAMDYRGAIESFTDALEVNPHSAAAHLELGVLHAERESDPAAAIYHYEQYLKLRPSVANAETIRQHIFGLKQELAKSVMPLPATPGVQREFEQLTEQNRQLNEQIRALQEELERVRVYYSAQGAVPTNSVRGATSGGRATSSMASGALAQARQGGVTPPGFGATGTIAGKTHRVQAGESPYSIARKHGMKVDELLAMNPGLNPRRMQVGQMLNLPSR